ncbi:AMIN domain-containing protein [Hankyongella ginsenosidimutans]|uniref:AMIN domain-containing protein n=1 Tax=Hankyongella ginsenosidimutans TaxID=1763828 RepID=A0A4D7C8P6_9SPHN|nr:AMIN domain-containing protein [Hankyongella ginsenosidimutans]
MVNAATVGRSRNERADARQTGTRLVGARGTSVRAAGVPSGRRGRPGRRRRRDAGRRRRLTFTFKNLDEKLAASQFSMAGPGRIVLDFKGTVMRAGAPEGASALVGGVRASQFSPDASRVVIDLAQSATLESAAWGRGAAGHCPGAEQRKRSPRPCVRAASRSRAPTCRRPPLRRRRPLQRRRRPSRSQSRRSPRAKARRKPRPSPLRQSRRTASLPMPSHKDQGRAGCAAAARRPHRRAQAGRRDRCRARRRGPRCAQRARRQDREDRNLGNRPGDQSRT